MKHKFNYNWTLKDAIFTKNKGKVFSCFACGGGSTMGYKLAGFDVIGFNEIDPKMAECYIENHKPKHSYIEDIRLFKDREDLPEELYNLDILDGSPPCSSFSMAGNREKDWGKEKVFREGQSEQVLDTLFFDFIDLAEKLQPKLVIAENVEGIILGAAKEYVHKIFNHFEKINYTVKCFLLNSKKMGVPQKRKRVFFIAVRNDLINQLPINDLIMFDEFPLLDLEFNEPVISIRNFVEFEEKKETQNYSEKRFGDVLLNLDDAANTITSGVRFWLNEKYILKRECYNLIGSYPGDYNFKGQDNIYLIGMSVPPIMTAQIASRIYEQWKTIF